MKDVSDVLDGACEVARGNVGGNDNLEVAKVFGEKRASFRGVADRAATEMNGVRRIFVKCNRRVPHPLTRRPAFMVATTMCWARNPVTPVIRTIV